MYPIYKFELNRTGSAQAYPSYPASLSLDFEKQSQQEFFRAKLNGKLTFSGPDYDWIMAQAFDFKFEVTIYQSDDAGSTWTQLWRGQFFKTDCEFDGSAKTCKVTPSVIDQYTAILEGMEHEYNLIDLAPEIIPVNAVKRPLIQIYSPGESVIACFLGGMWWEQECDTESDINVLTQRGDGKPNFTQCYAKTVLELSDVPSGCPTTWDAGTDIPLLVSSHTYTQDGWRLRTGIIVSGAPGDPYIYLEEIATGKQWKSPQFNARPTMPFTVNLNPVSGTGSTGVIEFFARSVDFLSRVLCDVQNVGVTPTYQIGSDDIVPDNRNYRRVLQYDASPGIYSSTSLSNNPTKWGRAENGKYYEAPYVLGYDFFPIARRMWGEISFWFTYDPGSGWYQNFEQEARAPFVIKDSYPIWSVLSVLLGKVAPNITHTNSPAYSQFFYDDNPIVGGRINLAITPKSNIITSGYDQPAQTAPITLKKVFDMLRDCFRVYWYIDASNRLCLEHIDYFMHGGTYDGGMSVGVDLTNLVNPRLGKPWAFGQDGFSYDKPETAGRYQFGWMDDVTEPFMGTPIDVVSGYVNKESVEEIIVNDFTSDIDYILLNPSEISEDGFALLSPILQNGEYTLPFYQYDLSLILQNWIVSFKSLQRFYEYDMPAYECIFNGDSNNPFPVNQIKRLKMQSVKFPAKELPNLKKLIKTNVGSGVIEKLSLNLSSRLATATLKFDL